MPQRLVSFNATRSSAEHREGAVFVIFHQWSIRLIKKNGMKRRPITAEDPCQVSL